MFAICLLILAVACLSVGNKRNFKPATNDHTRQNKGDETQSQSLPGLESDEGKSQGNQH